MSQTLGMSRERVGDVLHVALLIVASVTGLCLTFKEPGLAALIMAGVGALALWRWHEPLDFLLMVSGLLFGPTMEFWATSTGLWHYPYPSVGELPAWVFTLWPVFPLCLVRLTHALLPPRSPSRLRPVHELGLGLAILAVEIPLLCGFGTDYPVASTLGTVVMLAPAFFAVRSPQAGMMLFISGVIGPVCESLPIAVGAWSYPHPVFLGEPLWLPTGYALFGFALVRVGMGLLGLMQTARAGQLVQQR